ncbi:hypothetical protein J437_LFUL001436 [Ladona fulva]|uniref:WD repeat-containing protein 75 second beta-propeller domain-containing protein n=1 Tax=Ladona fulva TaxID=123851 RepID=A0A8K0JXV7_LADFU|nr:hypothetical protein J437_LFUL001436 [Ladona fulva]
MANTEVRMNDNELVLKRKGGGSIVSHPPVFSSDSEVIYIVWGNSVRSYSTQTGEFLQEYEGLTERSAGVQLIRGTETLATCSRKGEIIFWSRKSAVVQERKVTIRLFMPCSYSTSGLFLISYEFLQDIILPPGAIVTGFHILRKEGDVFVVTQNSNKDHQSMLRFKPDCKTYQKLEMKLNKQIRCFAFGGELGKEYLGGISKQHLYVMKVKEGKVIRHTVGSENGLVCVTAHPTEEILATGDHSGRILIWRSFLDSKQPPKSIYHWHTLPVSDVCFSQEGSSMYSGGRECVMVKWFLEYQEKKFLPRIGAPIRYVVVSPDNVFVAACLDDNSIQLVNAQGKIKRVIQNFTWNAHISEKLPDHTILHKVRLDPRTNSLVMNGQPGHLQFFSMKSSKLLYNLDVVCQNYLTQERNAVIYNTDVTHVAFTSNGNWMATVEQRKDPEASLEVRLKFWKYAEKTQNFYLNTCVEDPHFGEVKALEMRPGSEDMLAVTSGADSKIKIWYLFGMPSSLEKESNSSSRECWHCDAVCTYKDLPVGDVGFSFDGSILGAVFSHSLTLWVPETSDLKSSLSHPYFRENIRQLQFGNGDCSHLVVCVMKTNVVVWNLLSLTVSWVVPIELKLLAADSLSSYMAGFTCDRDLIIFKPSDPQPVYTRKNICPDTVLQAIFVPLSANRSELSNWQQKSQLYFLNQYQELLALENPDENFKEAAGSGLQGDPEEGRILSLTPFGRMLAGVSQSTDVEPIESSSFISVGVPGEKEIKEFLSMPPHTMPPLRFICNPLLASLIRRTRKTEGKEDPEMDVDEDNDSGMESEENKDVLEEMERMEIIDEKPVRKIYRPRIESTPELEKALSGILKEKTDWVSSLL